MVIGPWLREVPEECSEGSSPTKAPMVAPVNRCQSPISTARANPVSVEMPRRQANRRVTAVIALSAASRSIASSSLARRARAVSTVS